MYFTFKRKVNDQWNIIYLFATMIRFSKTYAHFVLLWSIAKTKQFRSYALYWAQNHICLVKFYLFLENNKVLLSTDFVLWLNCVTLIVKQIVTSPQVTCSRCAFEDKEDEKKVIRFASLNLSYHINKHYSNPTLHLYMISQKSQKKQNWHTCRKNSLLTDMHKVENINHLLLKLSNAKKHNTICFKDTINGFTILLNIVFYKTKCSLIGIGQPHTFSELFLRCVVNEFDWIRHS